MKKLAYYTSELGYFQIGYEKEAIISINLVEDLIEKSERNELTDCCFHQLREYLDGERKTFDIPISLRGTEFQMKVWKELAKIPYGETRSYKEIAMAIQQPTAARAVGMANNKNPLLLVVPCHRVIGSNGSLVGYAEGLDKKEYFLTLEKKNRTR